MKELNLSKFGISILICTYNPNEQIFARTLNSVAALTIREDLLIECIIIDNNSSIPVSQLPYVREFLDRCSWAQVILETQQGLTYARIAGIGIAKNPVIIFIDDDNEVLPSYIEAIENLYTDYPMVGVWGPGIVNVEFIGEVSDWFRMNFKSVFQERHVRFNEYGCVPETYTSFYPFGTGLAVRREILEKYRAEVKSGNLSSTGRKGQALSSGEDIQIVWEGIKMGYAAGIAPALSLNHLIPNNRSNLEYVKRLNFGTAASYLPCLYSSFPEVKSLDISPAPSSSALIQTIIKQTIKYLIKFKLNLLVTDLASYLGSAYGRYQVLGKSNPFLNFTIDRLKLR